MCSGVVLTNESIYSQHAERPFYSISNPILVDKSTNSIASQVLEDFFFFTDYCNKNNIVKLQSLSIGDQLSPDKACTRFVPILPLQF